MPNTNKKQEKLKKEREQKLLWALHEWDCRTLEEAKELAKTDKQLHLFLRTVGVKFDA